MKTEDRFKKLEQDIWEIGALARKNEIAIVKDKGKSDFINFKVGFIFSVAFISLNISMTVLGQIIIHYFVRNYLGQ